LKGNQKTPKVERLVQLLLEKTNPLVGGKRSRSGGPAAGTKHPDKSRKKTQKKNTNQNTETKQGKRG